MHSFAMGYSATIALPVHLIQALFCNGLFCYQSTCTYYFIEGLIYNSDSDHWDTHCECHLQHTKNENVHLMAFIAMRGVLTGYKTLNPTLVATMLVASTHTGTASNNTWPVQHMNNTHTEFDKRLGCPLASPGTKQVVTNIIRPSSHSVGLTNFMYKDIWGV